MSSSLLDLYSDYLISSFCQTSATGLSRLTDGAVSHDRITRFLSEPKKTGADLWHHVKPLVRSMQSSDGVLIFDDTIEEKPYTDENDIVCVRPANGIVPKYENVVIGRSLKRSVVAGTPLNEDDLF